MSQTFYTPQNDAVHNNARYHKSRAEDYFHNPDKTRLLYEEAVKKANADDNPQAAQADSWLRTKAFFRMLKAYAKGEYTSIPWGSFLLFAGAILYFISPIDLLVDWVPVAGYIDDVVVVVFVIRQFKRDIDTFIFWEESRKHPGTQIIDL